MSQGRIYAIINKQSGHKYIGQTTQTLNKRWSEHIQAALRLNDAPLHRAMRKYGNHNFMIREIDECEEELLNEREQYWIEYYNTSDSTNGYNNTVFNEEIKEKLPEEEKPKPKSWNTLTNENRGNGKHCGIRIQSMNIETGEIIEWENSRTAAAEITGNANRGSNILLSAKKGYIAYGHRWKILEHKTKKKAVKAINKVTWEEIHFESIKDAMRKVSPNTRATGLIKALRSNGRYTFKGFMWFYL